MSRSLCLVIAQLDFLVGDVAGNARKIIEAAGRARDEHRANAILFPELALTGYPPEDLLLRPGLQRAVEQALDAIQSQVSGIDIVLGFPERTEAGLFNAAALLRDGARVATYHKCQLPNYGVFDEKRYFLEGDRPCVVEIAGVSVGLTICEDIWYSLPVMNARQAGAQLILNLNASPYHRQKHLERAAELQKRVRETGLPVVYANLVGGQDELVFDGGSLVMAATGAITQQAPAFEEGLYPVMFSVDAAGVVTPQTGALAPAYDEVESVYRALVLGVRDYVQKNRFPGAIIGLSGGIDSALTLAITVDALGAENVEALLMPSRYTLDMSVADAQEQAEVLGVRYRIIPIETAFSAFLDALQEAFAGNEPDATEENIQARCRGILLMALSNKKHKVVITTGNKSEMSVGYATLYGDMAGGFSALKDVPKTLVYALSHYRNRVSPVIPQRVIERPPSAELAEGQQDTDSLPPYEVLDVILEMYIEQDRCADDIIAAGYDAETVRRVIRMVNRNEYKRRQAAPGVRISQRAFGRDRRYPITSGYDRD
ncbi:MAG: NAD+ synthase [Gammaproteobacteria bacterium]|nr:NAD+ synthase [Gammaproteobacteria bacterium]